MNEADTLRSFIRQHFRVPKRVPLTDDQELLPDVIDPLGVLELADFVEEAFDIRFKGEDLFDYSNDFRSLRTIVALIERKRNEEHTP